MIFRGKSRWLLPFFALPAASQFPDRRYHIQLAVYRSIVQLLHELPASSLSAQLSRKYVILLFMN